MSSHAQSIHVPSLLRIKPKALGNIGRYLFDYLELDSIALFYGTGMEELFGARVKPSLESKNVTALVKKEIGNIDFEGISTLAFSLPGEVKGIVAVGGGTVVDCAKYCGYLLQKPVVSVPTAISNDAFCSPGASLRVHGERRSLPAWIPAAVIIDTDVIALSPKMMTLSGLGDVVSNLTAIHDWTAAAEREGVPANDLAKFISLQGVYSVVNFPVKDVTEPSFIQTISVALTLSGVAMTIAESSRPASGSEHLISHAYDKLAEKPHLHGIQVGVATYLCSALQNNRHHHLLQNFLEETGFFTGVRENPLNKETFLKAVEAAPSIKKNFHTILSEPESLGRAKVFIEGDEIMTSLLI